MPWWDTSQNSVESDIWHTGDKENPCFEPSEPPRLPERKQHKGQECTEPTCFSSNLHPQTYWFRKQTTIFPLNVLWNKLCSHIVLIAFQCFIKSSFPCSQSSPKTEELGCCSKCFSVRRKKNTEITPIPHS